MDTSDWVIVALYFVASAWIGLVYARRAGRSTQEFFLSGRNLPWWLAGTSMVATTFAADTPLAVTELVARHGIAGNWLWWNFVFGGMLTVVFFARLWRRAGVTTDVEFVELRYSGKPAAFLRGFRAIYVGVFMNCIIMAWVNLAMASILEGMFGIPHGEVLMYVALALALTAGYSALSGLWGVAVTDAFQFLLAMAGCIVLAAVVLALPEVGGIPGLQEKLPSWAFRFMPAFGEGEATGEGALALGGAAFAAFIGVQWWASWYPGAEPGGGGYVAQRMMSARDERHSVFATLWFMLAHYCIRPWPWILVGLASVVLYPHLGPEEKRLGYVFAMRDYLPSGLRGLLIAAFFAAYMSTIATQLNWGTSYVVNDLYRRFIRHTSEERHLVRISRLTTVLIMLLSIAVTHSLQTISGAWAFILEAGAGLGLVLILRWYWWRVNAWSEITAMITPLAVVAILRLATRVEFPQTLFVIVALTTVAWVVVTFLTPPTESWVLERFYRRVHPGGRGWRPVAALLPDVAPDRSMGALWAAWALGVVLIYAGLFGIGHLVLGAYGTGIAMTGIAVLATLGIVRILSPEAERTFVR